MRSRRGIVEQDSLVIRAGAVDLGDGIIASASEILARCIKAGGMHAYDDVVDEIILERGGRLGVTRRARRWLRHRLREPPADTESPAISIGEPQRIADSGDIYSAAWAGPGVVGYTRALSGAPYVVTAWADLASPPRRVTELRGCMTSRPSPSPTGDRIALHVMRDGRPGPYQSWANDFASCLLIDTATGETRSILDSTHDFELSEVPVWSADGTRIAIAGLDRRGDPPLRTAIRVLDVSTGRSVASIERRALLTPLRFDGDAVILRLDEACYRWRPGTTSLEDIPPEPRRHRYLLPSGEPANVFDEHPDGRVLLKRADVLWWSVRV
jgi:hypothetical protein